MSERLPELCSVVLRDSLRLTDGRVLPAGERGVVVHAYASGDMYEIEFSLPIVVGLPGAALKRVE